MTLLQLTSLASGAVSAENYAAPKAQKDRHPSPLSFDILTTSHDQNHNTLEFLSFLICDFESWFWASKCWTFASRILTESIPHNLEVPRFLADVQNSLSSERSEESGDFSSESFRYSHLSDVWPGAPHWRGFKIRHSEAHRAARGSCLGWRICCSNFIDTFFSIYVLCHLHSKAHCFTFHFWSLEGPGGLRMFRLWGVDWPCCATLTFWRRCRVQSCWRFEKLKHVKSHVKRWDSLAPPEICQTKEWFDVSSKAGDSVSTCGNTCGDCTSNVLLQTRSRGCSNPFDLKVPLRFYISSSCFDKSSAYTVAAGVSVTQSNQWSCKHQPQFFSWTLKMNSDELDDFPKNTRCHIRFFGFDQLSRPSDGTSTLALSRHEAVSNLRLGTSQSKNWTNFDDFLH